MRLMSIVALAGAAVLCAGAANAQIVSIHFAANLTGASEVPANDSAGKGELTAELDPNSKVLTYRATYSGLSGPAIAAHFHGPAAPGANGPPVVMVKDPSSPIAGSAILTDDQVADLEAGKWYFNIHTQAHAGGEIRGQVERQN